MQNVKRWCGAILAVCLMLSLCVGCSTPEVAMTVDGEEYSTGLYLAHLYNVFYAVYQGNYMNMYQSYGLGDPWEKEFDYIQGETTIKLKTAEYMKQLAQDSLVRQRAVQKLMEQYGAALSEDDIKELDAQVNPLQESQLIKLGFNKQSYRTMLSTTSYEEPVLFYSLYDKGGVREVPETDVRAYFDKNYLVYKSIEIALTDSEGKAMNEEDTAKVRERLEGYLKIYTDTGSFNRAIEKYKADNENNGVVDETKEIDETQNVQEINAETVGNDKLVEAVRSVEEGTAKIVTYETGASQTMSLILRMDPEGEGREDYYENSRKAVLQNMRYEEYNKEITDFAKTLTVEVNSRAIKMCDPKLFEG